MFKWFFATRKRSAVTSAAGTVVLCAGIATAAWLAYTGLSGAGGSQVGQPSQTVGALTLADDPALQAPTDFISAPGTKGAFVAGVTNNNPNQSETITGITVGSLTVTPSACASHITVDSTALTNGLVGQVIPVGWSDAGGNSIHIANVFSADSTLPLSCAGATLDLTVTGTTTP